MVVSKEVRIPLPIKVEEYGLAQRWCVAKASRENTGAGEGVEVVVNEPRVHETYGPGQYTEKRYHIRSYVPGWMRWAIPKSLSTLVEVAWNCFPYCVTSLSCPGLAKFKLEVVSWHYEGKPDRVNVHGLSEEALKAIEVIVLDIRDNSDISKKEYVEEEDPGKYFHEGSGRGRLAEGWQVEDGGDLMTCYKKISINSGLSVIGGKVDAHLAGIFLKLFLRFHRQLFCWMDGWYGVDAAGLLVLEDEVQRACDDLRKDDSAVVQGYGADIAEE